MGTVGSFSASLALVQGGLTGAAEKVAPRIDEVARQGTLTETSPRPISWVLRVDRPTIGPDIRAKAAQLDEPFREVVAALAERLERPSQNLLTRPDAARRDHRSPPALQCLAPGNTCKADARAAGAAGFAPSVASCTKRSTSSVGREHP